MLAQHIPNPISSPNIPSPTGEGGNEENFNKNLWDWYYSSIRFLKSASVAEQACLLVNTTVIKG